MYENRILPVIRPDFITEVLPNYFISDYPNIVIFLQYYYDSLDSDGEFGDIVKDLYHITNISVTELKYLDNLFYELGLNVSKELFNNPREVLRNFAEFFRTKGSEQSLKQFFRMFYNAEAKVTYPKDEIFILNDPESRIGPESLKRIQDGRLYQILSIFIQSPIGYKEYEELYKKFVHPAGFYVGALAEVYSEHSLKVSGFQDSNIIYDPTRVNDEKILSPEVKVIPILKSDIGFSDILVFDGETIQGVVGNTFSHGYDNVNHYTDKKWFLTSEDAGVNILDSSSTSADIIFNTWYRFSHDNSGVYPANLSETLSWVYDIPTQSIICNANTSTYVGLISKLSSEKYNIEATVGSGNADDDAIALVLAYVEESNREYTISAVRSMGGIAPTSGFGLYYNYSQSDQKLIASKTVTTKANPGNGGWDDHGPVRLKGKRNLDNISVYTSQEGSLSIDSSTLISIDLSSDPDLYKFIGPTKNGYATRSQSNAYFSDIINDLQTPLVFGADGYGSILETAGHNVRSALAEGIHNPAMINIAALDPKKTLATEDLLYPPSLGIDPSAKYSIFDSPPNKLGFLEILGIPSGSNALTIDLKSIFGYNAEKINRKDSKKYLTRAYIKGNFTSSNELRLYGLDSDPTHAFVIGDGSFNGNYTNYTLDTEFPVIKTDNFIDSNGILNLTITNPGTSTPDLILGFSYKYNTIYDWIKFDSTAVFDINNFVYADNRNIRDVVIQEIKNKNIMYLKDTII